MFNTQAISFATKKEKAWLARTELIHFIDFLRRDQITADVYMAIEEDDVQKEWVCIQMECMNIIVFPDFPDVNWGFD